MTIMWFPTRTIWLLLILLAVASSSYQTRKCCPDNIIISEKAICNNGSKIDLECDNTSHVILREQLDYKIEERGLVIGDTILTKQEFCTGLNEEGGLELPSAVVCFSSIIYGDNNHEDKHLYSNLYSYFLLVSVLFLLATLAVYCGLPALWDLGGKCLMCFVGSLALGYSSLFALQQNFINYYDSPSTVCTVYGFWTYFWLLNSFTWLFLVSFNIWYQSKFVIKHVSEKVLWLLYMTFGFGLPLTYLLGAVISHHFPTVLLHPNIGAAGVCWLQGKTEIWVYLSGPMAVFLFFNIVFFILTARILWINYRDARPQSRIRRLRLKMALYLKLFLAMGLTWIFELASFAFSFDLFIADVLNSLQGPVIFILMVLTRRKVIKALTCSNSFITICLPCSKVWIQQETDDEHSTQVDIQLS